MKNYSKLTIANHEELVMGISPHPVRCGNDLTIGDGKVYPEINFTLPTMLITKETFGEVRKHYTEMMSNILERSKHLNVPGLVVEFEQLPPMTETPEWGAEITELIKTKLNKFYDETNIPNALRVTVLDLRDADHPPLLRSGEPTEKTLKGFELCAQAGADILSIESVGGKEVHDQALMYGDLYGMVASLGILAHRDMSWLWNQITEIANKYDIISGGDSACGFSNTAMQLAGQGMLPSVLAALDRAASAPRSLAAFEQGAVGPSKDCAYEGPIIKAITGYPISMEGKSACCAHFSPLGNIAAATADLWSNESVQNVRLLSGNAPEAFMELLTYDCRLYNTALDEGNALMMRNMLVKSDIPHSVEALMLEPKVVIEIAQSIVKNKGGYNQTKASVQTAFTAIENALQQNVLSISNIEREWMDKLKKAIDAMADSEEEALDYLKTMYGDVFKPEAYGL
ncbi:MAG: methyltransferase MtaB domain-containing protein [Bacteroidota bacterium]